MLRQISIPKLLEWRAYADLEPWDEERADIRTAHVVKTLRDIHRRKGQPSVSLEDCLLRFGDAGREEPPKDPREARQRVKAAMRTMMAMLNDQKASPKKKRLTRGAR